MRFYQAAQRQGNRILLTVLPLTLLRLRKSISPDLSLFVRSLFRVGFLTLPEREATCENVPFRRMNREMRCVLTGSNSEGRSLKLVTEFY